MSFLSRHGSAKPFLDGDFLRDSSNPLDVYEDMDITTPPPDTSAKEGKKDKEKGEEKDAGGKGKLIENATAASVENATSAVQMPHGPPGWSGPFIHSAVQMQKIASLRASVEEKASEAKASVSQATTAAPAVAKKEEASASKATALKAPVNETKEAAAVAANDASTASEALTKPGLNASKAEPAAPVELKKVSSCVTRKDERAVSFWSQTAAEGSPCIFGVDVRDEGSHCIAEMDFGSNGWCYTQDDQSAWGSCSQACPLYGPPLTLASKIDSMQHVLGTVSEKLDELTDEATKEVPSAVPSAVPTPAVSASQQATKAKVNQVAVKQNPTTKLAKEAL